MSTPMRVAVIGAGIGGLVAALRLAHAGLDVTVLERAPAPGGKMRALPVGPAAIEAGPTVFTMRWVLDEVFAECGASLDAHVALTPARLLARHAWEGDGTLDLFAGIDESAEAIHAFAGAREAAGYRRFCARAAEVYETLEGPFIRSDRPTALDLALRVGPFGLPRLWRIQPFATLWSALGEDFRDPRLRQLFARYATYCGSSPFEAPATLMLVAHVEQAGVWSVAGGLSALARAVADLAAARGARLRYGAEVRGIVVEHGRVAGLDLADGERLPAEAVICNADAAALGAGLLGPAATPPGERLAASERSLSAVTVCARAVAAGFPLARHTVFFSRDYRAEFDTILRGRRLPEDPTIYVCAQDRDEAAAPKGPERLLLLVNAPAEGPEQPSPQEIERCVTNLRGKLARHGLSLTDADPPVTTGPAEFAALFPGTRGALYGRASRGSTATFQRPAARTALPGLYLAGGSVHPGPGVPMAAQSGRLAARALLQDLSALPDRASTRRWRAAAMPGGMSTR
ncbi:1-hydroxycarotenoid 3,4-desaturase CrtD [Methylobacterium symbioticum]|uniref:1-hydroxycarotenoid 3,4-desaturase CrtD n=1 Tax=uncultured Methylobacterium sp. TaxID=157278 RepID=UPI0025948DDC|nr:1-hydroxycarotenoid 3,4-desaturase CrtD [uncultured Methylobacterium sp.]